MMLITPDTVSRAKSEASLSGSLRPRGPFEGLGWATFLRAGPDAGSSPILSGIRPWPCWPTALGV